MGQSLQDFQIEYSFEIPDRSLLIGTMFAILLAITVFIQLGGANHHIETCEDIGGRRIFFPTKLPEQNQVACADPNGANNFKSLRSSTCYDCAYICRKTGGCNYWTWVPHFLLPPGHHNCKLFKNFCCFREVKPLKDHPHHDDYHRVGIRISGSKFQDCPPYHKGYDGYGGPN